jgi:hypothetical protein
LPFDVMTRIRPRLVLTGSESREAFKVSQS